MFLTAIAVAISAVAFYFCTGFNHVWWAAWIAPIPVLLIALHATRGVARMAPFAAYLLGIIHLAPYLRVFIGWPLAILVPVLMAWAFQGCVLFARRCRLNFSPRVAVWAFPVAWTVFEFLVALFGPWGTVLNYAYSQLDFPPALQIASITGIWGISFIIMLWCSMWAMWSKRTEPALVLLFVVAAFSASRLQHGAGPPTPVALIAADSGIAKSWDIEDPPQAVAVANKWANLIALAAKKHPRVIVLPEKFLAITPADQQQVFSIFGNAARAARTTVVAGFNFIGIHPPRNIAAVFAPNGQPVLVYDKHHMLMGPETPYKPGNQPQFFNAMPGNWGVEICKDMDYPAWSRQYGKQNIQFLAVPAWDFVVDGYFHGRMAELRGVEDGFTVVHTAQQGLLYISDAYGRVIAEARSSSEPEVTLVHDAPAGPGTTFYARWGDWFGWLNLAALIGLIAALMQRKKTATV